MPARFGPKTTRHLIAIAAVVAVVAAACVPDVSIVGRAAPGGRDVAVSLDWTPCHERFQCATLPVPLDYARPGRQVDLALVRLPASDPDHRIGSLVVNPGGPGGSGVDFVVQDAEIVFPSDVRARFDVVGFDPRGVGDSSPISCASQIPPSAFVELASDADVEQVIADNEAQAERCRTDIAELPHLGTENVARDLDRIRAALGDGGLNYVGFSYGTLIGALYAQLFPGHIRSLVLDGAVDPSLDLAAFRTAQAAGFEAELTTLLDDCAAREACVFHSGGETRQAFDRVMARFGTPEAWAAIVSILYLDRSEWYYLDQALAAADAGDPSAIEALAYVDPARTRDARYINEAVAYRAVTCLDFGAPSNAAAYVTLSRQLAAKDADFGAMLGLADVGCAFWPTPPVRTPAPVRAPGAPPIVVVGSTRDPATPYAWAQSLAKQLSSAVLVTRDGDGHTGYMFSQCVRDAVDAYLFSLRVPRDGLRC